ncbi:hypothetical protein MY3296_006891 [Beauveria thailandica]
MSDLLDHICFLLKQALPALPAGTKLGTWYMNTRADWKLELLVTLAEKQEHGEWRNYDKWRSLRVVPCHVEHKQVRAPVN